MAEPPIVTVTVTVTNPQTTATPPHSHLLIQNLTSSNTATRSESLRELTNWLPTQIKISDDELNRLCTGLLFCISHADNSAPVQSNLIDTVSSLLLSLYVPISLQYLSIFLTTVRNTRCSDMNLLITRFVNYSFRLLKNNEFDDELCKCVMKIYEENLLLGNEVSYHIVSVFLDEFKSYLPVSRFAYEIVFLRFVNVMRMCGDKVLVSRIKSDVFDRLMCLGRSLLEKKRNGEDEIKDSEVVNLGAVALKLWFARWFSRVKAFEGNREVLIDLSKAFLKLEKDLKVSRVEIPFGGVCYNVLKLESTGSEEGDMAMNLKIHINTIARYLFKKDYVKASECYINSLPVEFQLNANEACIDFHFLPRGYEMPTAAYHSTAFYPKAYVTAIENTDYGKAGFSYINSLPVELRFETTEAFYDCLPLGWCFYATDEEIAGNYLQKKIKNENVPYKKLYNLDIYRKNHLEELEVEENYPVGNGWRLWYIFTPRYRKDIHSTEVNREDGCGGYWKPKPKCREEVISNKNRTEIGRKRSFVYYKGNERKRTKTDWFMEEYLGSDHQLKDDDDRDDMKLDYAICKICKGKEEIKSCYW